VDRSEPHGRDGILTRIHCINCGLERVSILADIEESAKRASDFRLKNGKAE